MVTAARLAAINILGDYKEALRDDASRRTRWTYRVFAWRSSSAHIGASRSRVR